METTDIRQFIPELIVSGVHQNQYVLHVQDNNDHYYTWYETPVANQKGHVGMRIYDENVPKSVIFDEDTYEVLGLLQGEMSKTYRQTLTFANSEPGIINKVLAWFEKTEFAKKSVWRWYVRVNLKEPADLSVKQEIDCRTAQEWIKLCNLNPSLAYDKRVSYIASTKNERLDGIGTLMVERASPIIIQTVLKMVSDMTLSMPRRSAEEIAAYMRGIIAAESCVNFDEGSAVRRILISAVKKDERDIFRICLEKLAIEARDKPNMRCLIITGKENLEKMHRLGLMTLHPEKHKKFLEMINSYTEVWHARRKL